MSRVIKFRYIWVFKNIFIKKVFTINQIENGAVSDFILSDDFPSYPLTGIKVQFTGLQDKNGVDIYESDVINVEYNYIGMIEVKFLVGAYNIAGFNLDRCSVAGNIHQNSDLLKSK